MEDELIRERYRAAGLSAGGARPTKACVECRRQKMRCEPVQGGPCRRCRNSKIECVFRPRANARLPANTTPVSNMSASDQTPPDVLARLAVIEAMLGIGGNNPISPGPRAFPSTSPTEPAHEHHGEDQGDPALSGLWPAIEALQRRHRSGNTRAWSKYVVSQLWLSFYANMEGLHFQSESEAFKNPTPLLLAATLYVSALHHTSAELAALAPEYFEATCSAISELSIPEFVKRPTTSSVEEIVPPLTPEQKAFQNILGLILAGLVSEAFVELTGIWISVGYRLILDYCPVYIDQSANKWRQLFSGLQVFIIDLEHASLHLSTTIVPIQAPLPSLRQLQSFTEDPFNRLTVMMHSGLSHFAGRGLPTIWSVISAAQPENVIAPVFPFTERDAQVIKDWARSLDDWLVSSNLSHPLSGMSFYFPHVPPSFSGEKTRMITWAAILVLQGAQGGIGEHEDLRLVQDHLDKLRKTNRPAPSLHHMLADRLDAWLQNMNMSPNLHMTQPVFDPSWSLFDQNSIQIASETCYPQNSLEGNSAVGNTPNNPRTHSQNLELAQQQNFDDPGFWNVYGDPTAAWPSGMTRLFGSTSFPESAHVENAHQ
ncbi:hypothetical protein ACEQ8H_006449 [Pleosporales sp. CAS-2024a]